MALKTGIGITIGSDSIRLIKGKRAPNGLIQILDALVVPSPLREDSNPEMLQKEAINLIKKNKFSGSGLMGITGRELILRYIQVPNVPEQRLRAMLDYEVGELSERSGGDLATDFRLLSSQALNLSADERFALVALTKNNFLEPIFRKIQKLRLTPNGAIPTSIALFRSFVRHGSFDSDEKLLLVEIGKNNMDLCLCQQSKLMFARNLSGGSSLLTEAIEEQLGLPPEEAERLKIQESNLLPGSSDNKVNSAIRYGAGQLLSAIKSTISFAKLQIKYHNLAVDRIILSGAGAQQKGLPEYLSQGLNLPVECYDPTAELDLSLCSSRGKELISNNPSEWAAPLGVLEATTDDVGFSIQLVPSSFEKRSKFLEGPLFIYLTVLFTISYLGIHFISIQRQHSSVSYLNKQLVSQRNRLEEMKETNSISQENTRQYQGKLSVLEERILPGTHFFRVIAKLKAKIPPHIWIKSLSVKEDEKNQTKVIEIEGIIEESEKDVIGELLDFTAIMEEDPDVQQCEPIKRERDAEYGRLVFTCWLRFKK